MKKLLMAAAIVTGVMMSSGTGYAQGAKIPDVKLEELRKKSIEHFFKFYDADGDQAVSKAEFMEVMEKRFTEMDQDANGTVTTEEVLAHHTAMQEKMMKERDAAHQQGGAAQ